ncbi:MAG: hypothetical protein ACPG21_02445 [Crocinitomicaceae bacterium]
MDWADIIAENAPHCPPAKEEELREMQDDIYYHFSQMDGFEVLRVEQMGEDIKRVVAACVSTMDDPFFKVVVAHIWQRDLAYDNQWHLFESNEMGTVFRFLTWEDEYICGEIWFDRSKGELLP